jgi:hypothetical protein
LKRKSLKFKRCKVSHEEGKMSHCDQTGLFYCPQNRILHEEGCCRILLRVKEEKNIVETIERRKANRIGHILRRNRPPKHIPERKIEVTGRRGRRRKQGLDDFKGIKIYCRLKEEALDRSLWRTGFGIACGLVLRQTAW